MQMYFSQDVGVQCENCMNPGHGKIEFRYHALRLCEPCMYWLYSIIRVHYEEEPEPNENS